MTRNRGISLVELLVGVTLMSLLFIVGMSLFTSSLSSLTRTDRRLDITESNALALRRVSEELRSAFTLSIEPSGQAIFYEMPEVDTTIDSVTGEREYLYPLRGDGITRRIYFQNGSLYHQVGTDKAREIADEVVTIDPDPYSSYYNKSYPMFSFANIGSANGLKIILIAESPISGEKTFNRQTVTVLMRNYR